MIYAASRHPSLRRVARVAIPCGSLALAALLLAGCRKEASEAKTPPPPTQTFATLIPGTSFVAALQEPVSTGENKVGDKVRLQTIDDVRAAGVTVVPAGSRIDGVITELHKAERIKQHAELTLAFTQLVLPDGKAYDISCTPFHLKAQEKKGIVHDVLETGAAVITKGHQIELAQGQQIKVSLSSSVKVAVKHDEGV
jgi:hypothetical protein